MRDLQAGAIAEEINVFPVHSAFLFLAYAGILTASVDHCVEIGAGADVAQ
ncbi:hypothetical protein [Chelativorans sp. AA-79]|nr:hypothetical protein [Chelativorans sp. AA-79]WEX10298.1 hypothetical protein PVE73_04885 [Chelativorans sp. AA-79]